MSVFGKKWKKESGVHVCVCSVALWVCQCVVSAIKCRTKNPLINKCHFAQKDRYITGILSEEETAHTKR